MSSTNVIKEVPGFYRIIALNQLRHTPGVDFDAVPMDILPRIDAIDRVLHTEGANSPGAIENVQRPWYMHPYQDDNLMVLHGRRSVDIYAPQISSKVESFEITPNEIHQNGEPVCEGPAILVWPHHVFHRIVSDPDIGSASVNFAVHYDGFNLRDNFSIYDIDIALGTHRVIREGHLDQP